MFKDRKTKKTKYISTVDAINATENKLNIENRTNKCTSYCFACYRNQIRIQNLINGINKLQRQKPKL